MKNRRFGAYLPSKFGLVSVWIGLHLLDVVALLVEVDELSSPLIDFLPHLRELALVGVEGNHNLIPTKGRVTNIVLSCLTFHNRLELLGRGFPTVVEPSGRVHTQTSC